MKLNFKMSFAINSLCIFITLTIAGYFFLKKKFAYFKDNGIPHIKPSSLIVGNLSGLGKSIHIVDFLKKLYSETKGQDVIAGFYTFFNPTIVATDLELVKHILVKEFNNFTDRGIFSDEEREPLTGNLSALRGEKWRFLRNKLSPAFTSGKLKTMFSTIFADKGDNFVKAIDNAAKNGSIDMKEMSNRYTIDVISSAAFGMEANTLNYENPDFVEVFDQVFGTAGGHPMFFVIMTVVPKLMKVICFLRIPLFNKFVTKFFNNIVGDSIKYRESRDVKRNDFLNMIVQLKNKGSIDGEISSDNRKLTLNECIAQSAIFFLAGGETSSTIVSYAMIELGLHPKIQEKLREEIRETMKDSDDGEITYEKLHEMAYLNQVVNETLRKYPPGAFTTREAMHEYKIPNSKHVIKEGSLVMIPNICFHYDERYWKTPEEFNPDRFLPEEVAKRPHLSFIPFGEGQRACIGQRFAQVNVKFAVATMIKNFKVKVDKTKTTVPLRFDPKVFSIAPKGGFWVNIEKV